MLARLLLLAHLGTEREPEMVIAKISEGTLTEVVGTTRSFTSFVVNKLRTLGFIDYKAGRAGTADCTYIVLSSMSSYTTRVSPLILFY